MKPKKFKDGSWAGFVFIEIFHFFILLLAIFLDTCLNLAAKNSPNFSSSEIGILILGNILCLGMGIALFLWGTFSHLTLDRAYGKLWVYEDRVVFQCPFRRTRTLTFEECKYIGIENYNDLIRGLPIERGDEAAFIYFSTKPYPEKYKGKISRLKNTDDFIKIGYSDALAEALIDILPADKDYLIRSFYNKMQARDRELEKKKKKKK